MNMPRSSVSGYTLIEVLIVLAIIGLVAGFAMPPAVRIIEGAMLATDARTVVSELRSAKADAMEKAATVTLDNATGGGIADSRGEALDPPNGSAIRIASPAISFFADGTTNGGVIEVVRGRRTIRLQIDWLTGTITVGGAS